VKTTDNSIQINLQEQLIYGYESVGSHIIPPHYQPKEFTGDTLLWMLPCNPDSGKALCIQADTYRVKRKRGAAEIRFHGAYSVQEFPPRPCCDFLGAAVSLQMAHGAQLEMAWARFYWEHLLPQMAERTYLREKMDIREGYVLSTLNKKAYAGTYPAVDHEFHIKGRLAVSGAAEQSLVRRMLELQFKIMREDKKGISRSVCAIQPRGSREYDVWRDSRDHSCRAQMFRITANIEIVEAVYAYYCRTKDIDFLRANIAALEKSCACIERFIAADGLLESHVHYEDQVMKDGKVAQSQFLAVHSFRLMAQLEALLTRAAQAAHYAACAERLGETAVRAYPNGYWDAKEKRFLDWIDAKGAVHDHIHLLANALPVLFGLADGEQKAGALATIAAHEDIFSKFPSYVAAKIEDYTEAEIGTGGPYDLCAAGRYWCWDAAFKAFLQDGAALEKQLLQVANQAEIDGFRMGERYDMNYVYYNTGKDGERNWHGASDYYEYPNVFLYVLTAQYLGVRSGFDCDVVLAPLVQGDAAVTLENYSIAYEKKGTALTVKNISGRFLSVDLPLHGKRILLQPGEESALTSSS